MTLADRWRERRAHWRRSVGRWVPQVPIALAIAPLGVILLAGFFNTEIGVRLSAVEMSDIERVAPGLGHRPILEAALGLSLLAMSVGIALRSRLAWLWSVGAVATGLALRLPPEPVEIPVALYMGGVLFLLLHFRHRFASRSVLTSGVFAIVILSTFFLWATLGALRLGDHFHPPVRDMVTALYLAVVTMSSVGYGDIVPVSQEARLFVVGMIGIGLVVGATSLSAILLPLIGSRVHEIVRGRTDVERFDHYVIVGKSPLARNAATELERRGQRVTHIVASAPDEDFYQKRDVVVGDPTNLAVLRAAETEKAKGVLALSTDDATNGFVVLGVNELDPTIPTVAALNDPSNQFRLERTQPSMMLSLQALGGELLAMALTGEHVDLEMLTRVLQVHGEAPDAKS